MEAKKTPQTKRKDDSKIYSQINIAITALHWNETAELKQDDSSKTFREKRILSNSCVLFSHQFPSIVGE